MSNDGPTVSVVDDDPAVLKSLSRLLRACRWNVATYASAHEFLQQHDPLSPGCLVLDVSMPRLSGLDLQEALARQGSRVPIIFLTGRADVPTCLRAMKGGAMEFLTKPVNDDELIQAIQAALDGDRKAQLARAHQDDLLERVATLTPREREVLAHVISGKLNKQIASHLGTVEKTIKVHRARVMEKMAVQSLAELVRVAERAGIRPADP